MTPQRRRRGCRRHLTDRLQPDTSGGGFNVSQKPSDQIPSTAAPAALQFTTLSFGSRAPGPWAHTRRLLPGAERGARPSAPSRRRPRRGAGRVPASPASPAALAPGPAVSFAALRRVTPARSRPGPATGAGCAARPHVPPPPGGRRGRRVPLLAPAPRLRARRHVYRGAPQVRGLRGVRESAG